MAKKKKADKRKTLDQILFELQKLKGEVRTLGKQQAELAVVIDKLAAKKTAASRSAPKAAKSGKGGKAPTAGAARKAAAAPKRPVLVATPGSATG